MFSKLREQVQKHNDAKIANKFSSVKVGFVCGKCCNPNNSHLNDF